MMCQVCGCAPVKRWEFGLGVCGKLAHRLDTKLKRDMLLGAQRRKRRALALNDDAEKERGIFQAFGARLKAIFSPS